jgi:hypothetical protein
MFGYRNGVQVNTKFSPFMVLTGRTPRLTCDNSLAAFNNVEKEELTLEEMTQLMVRSSNSFPICIHLCWSMWTKHIRGNAKAMLCERGNKSL